MYVLTKKFIWCPSCKQVVAILAEYGPYDADGDCEFEGHVCGNCSEYLNEVE